MTATRNGPPPADTGPPDFGAAALCHDVRSPLGIIALQVALAEQAVARAGAALPAEVAGAFRTIACNVRAVDGLLVGYLGPHALAGRCPHGIGCDLGEVAAEVAAALRPVADAKGLWLRVAAEPGLRVPAARFAAERALANLVGNAVRYTRSGGVELAAVRTAGGAAAVHVSDTGPGVLPGRLAALLGGTDGAPGCGQGLGIARRLAAAAGGRVTAVSRVGSGSRFTLELGAEDCHDDHG